MSESTIQTTYRGYHQLVPSSLVPVPFVLGGEVLVCAAALAPARSLELSKLWKKFCKTSCCVCPPTGLGEFAVGEIGGLPRCVPLAAAGPPPVVNVDATGLVPRESRRSAAVVPVTLEPRFAPTAPAPPLTPASISVSARSTFGRLKLLLPNGPTMPAAAFSSNGLRNALRGS
jgi:hypothetical protein